MMPSNAQRSLNILLTTQRQVADHALQSDAELSRTDELGAG